MKDNKLFIIPARKGSKGLPGKNIKLLGAKPLIAYTIEFAKSLARKDDVICISTDDQEVIKIANDLGIEAPFLRPDELASDTANTFQVLKHAISFYKNEGVEFKTLVLLQPTSPFREVEDFSRMEEIYLAQNPDMVVSVKISKDSPYFNLFEEDSNGNLNKFFQTADINCTNRQECPPVYSYNGSIYLVNNYSFLIRGDFNFDRKIKYVMPDSRSIDIDTPADWALSEFYLNHKNENSKNNS